MAKSEVLPLPGESTRAALGNPVLRYVLATRPPFLSVTVVGVLIGWASAYADGAHVSALLAMVATGWLPAACSASLAGALATLAATKVLWGAADRPQALAPALPLTIVVACGHGLLMAATLALFS